MSILNIDDQANIVDVLFKFDAGAKIVMHRHTSVFNTFVVSGHHIYSPDGELAEYALPELIDVASPVRSRIRKAAAVRTLSFFSACDLTCGAAIYEILDENQEVVATMNFNAQKSFHDANAA